MSLPKIGNLAPKFTLENQNGKKISLKDYIGKNVVLYFYPKALTPGCTTQAIDITTHKKDFTKLKTVVLAVSPDPVDKLKKFEEMPMNSFIRVGVKSGGCSGLSYDLSFDTELQENDQEFEDNDVKVVIEKKSLLYLAGTTLEYEGGLNGKGFSFSNPNASRTCGCGESFAV